MRLTQLTNLFRAPVERLAADETGAAAAGAVASIAKIAVISTFFPLGLRTVAWLQDGIWPVMTLDSLGLDAPRIGWTGAQLALNTVFTLPVELVAFVFCGAIYGIASAALDERRASHRKLAGPG
ncbi:MAG: hypothetical protein O3B08_12430 [Proteobacteria bacterium]|nr:hypothetical protein [Pseudomonadota bacterium]